MLVYTSPAKGAQGAQLSPIEFAGEPINPGAGSSRRHLEDPFPATQLAHVRLASPKKSTFTSGVQALMTPSARKAAAPEAFADAVHALAVMQGAEPELFNSISKRLAAAAVHTVTTELAAEAYAQAQHQCVPQGAWGTDGRPYRWFSTDGPTPIVPTPKPAFQKQYTPTDTPLAQYNWGTLAAMASAWPTSAGGMHMGMQDGLGSAQQQQSMQGQGQHMQEELRRQAQLLQGFHSPAQQLQGFQGWSQQQQGFQGPAQQLQDGYGQGHNLHDGLAQAEQLQGDQGLAQQLQDWGGSSVFAAPAATGNNNWVVGAFGIAGSGCTYWTHHQQDLAAFAADGPAAYHNTGPLCAGLDPTGNQHLQLPFVAHTPPQQQYMSGGAHASARKPGDIFACQPAGDTSIGRRTRSSYKQPKARTPPRTVERPEARPSSPHLDGVDYWTDKHTIVCMSPFYNSAGRAAANCQVPGDHKGPQRLSRCSSFDSELRVSGDELMNRSSSL